jgi:uncharacterized membrane protein YphA (DoxX/SURF4 family)
MKSKILFIAALLFGLMFINAGLNKFFNYMPLPESMPAESVKDFAAMVEIAWLMPLIAVVEIVGGLLFIITKTRALAVLILFPVMLGIILANFVDTSGLPIVAVLLAIYGWVMYLNWNKYLPIIK